jgi:hypothetical protein
MECMVRQSGVPSAFAVSVGEDAADVVLESGPPAQRRSCVSAESSCLDMLFERASAGTGARTNARGRTTWPIAHTELRGKPMMHDDAGRTMHIKEQGMRYWSSDWERLGRHQGTMNVVVGQPATAFRPPLLPSLSPSPGDSVLLTNIHI